MILNEKALVGSRCFQPGEVASQGLCDCETSNFAKVLFPAPEHTYDQDRTELGTMVSAVNCAQCKYGYLLPRHPLDYSSAWECSDCDMVLDNDTVAAKLAKFEDQIEKMEKNKVEN